MTGGAPVGDHTLLCRAVRAGGAIALDYFEHGFDVREKHPGDPVTEADLAVDAALRETLLAARPDYGWLSEESEDGPARLGARRVWVVDPIDGTRGFVDGTDEWVVSVALVEAGRPVSACVFNPSTAAFYDAVEGGGTRLNGNPVRIADRPNLSGAALASSRNEQRRALWRDRFPEAEIRIVDAIAWKLALVAGGVVDGTIALRPKSDWDIAAGDLLIREAGGAVTTPEGETMRYNGRSVRKEGLVAAGPALHRRLIARLRARS